MRLILARHPKPLIAPGLCYGRRDIGLADAADAQAQAAMIRALQPAQVWTSPATRCRRPAEATGLPLRIDARLQELDFGAWEGLAWDRVPRAALDAWAADPHGFAPPGGESGAALCARVQAVFAEIVAAGADAAVVSHGGPLRLLVAWASGAPPDLLAPAPPVGWVQAFTLAR